MRLRLSGPSVPRVLIVAGSGVFKVGGSVSGKEVPTAVAVTEYALDGVWLTLPVELSSSGNRVPSTVACSSSGAWSSWTGFCSDGAVERLDSSIEGVTTNCGP